MLSMLSMHRKEVRALHQQLRVISSCVVNLLTHKLNQNLGLLYRFIHNGRQSIRLQYLEIQNKGDHFEKAVVITTS